MKRTSVPEQAILYYTRKYLDPCAKNNGLTVDRYTADVSFTFSGKNYIAEYDSYSMHHNRIDKDTIRDNTFAQAGYTVIRLRDAGLPFLETSINIRFVFDNYKQKMLDKANEGINEYLSHFGCCEQIDIRNDLEEIKHMYDAY